MHTPMYLVFTVCALMSCYYVGNLIYIITDIRTVILTGGLRDNYECMSLTLQCN